MNENGHSPHDTRFADQVGRALQWRLPVVKCVLVLLVLGFLVWGVFRRRGFPTQGKDVELAPFVESVRDQLEKVERDRVEKNLPALFRVKDIDLEVTVVARQGSKGSGEVRAEVVTAGMQEELSREASQKVILHMTLAPPETVGIEQSDHPLSTEGGKWLTPERLEKKK